METNIRNKCKAYTSLEQSKKLAEILPIESADQTWARIAIAGANLDVPEELQFKHNGDMPFKYYSGIGIPCWSLTALLEELNRNCWNVSLKCCGAEWDMTYDDGERYISVSSDYTIDACIAMIEKLHELKML